MNLKLQKFIKLEINLWLELSTDQLNNSRYLGTINPEYHLSKLGFMNLVIDKNSIAFNDIKELIECIEYYESKSSSPYFLTTFLSENEQNIIEHSRYLYLDRFVISSDYSNGAYIEETNNIKFFCSIVKKGFEYDKSFESSFLARMKYVSKKVESKFFILKNDNNTVVGAISYFRVKGSSEFCGMNGCILKDYRSQGLAEALVVQSLKKLETGMYARTSNPAMVKVLKKVGFSETEDFKIVELKK